MFSSSKWIFRVINTQIVTIITIIFHFLLFRLFPDSLSSSSCNTNMSTFTILTNPAAIRPKTKHACRKNVLTNPSINSFFTHQTLALLYNAHYHFSPHIHLPLSMFLPLHPSHCHLLSHIIPILSLSPICLQR